MSSDASQERLGKEPEKENDAGGDGKDTEEHVDKCFLEDIVRQIRWRFIVCVKAICCFPLADLAIYATPVKPTTHFTTNEAKVVVTKNSKDEVLVKCITSQHSIPETCFIQNACSPLTNCILRKKKYLKNKPPQPNNKKFDFSPQSLIKKFDIKRIDKVSTSISSVSETDSRISERKEDEEKGKITTFHECTPNSSNNVIFQKVGKRSRLKTAKSKWNNKFAFLKKNRPSESWLKDASNIRVPSNRIEKRNIERNRLLGRGLSRNTERNDYNYTKKLKRVDDESVYPIVRVKVKKNPGPLKKFFLPKDCVSDSFVYEKKCRISRLAMRFRRPAN